MLFLREKIISTVSQLKYKFDLRTATGSLHFLFLSDGSDILENSSRRTLYLMDFLRFTDVPTHRRSEGYVLNPKITVRNEIFSRKLLTFPVYYSNNRDTK